MIWENWDPFKKNKREALIKKMVLKRLGDEIRPISYQKFVFFHARTTFSSTITSFWAWSEPWSELWSEPAGWLGLAGWVPGAGGTLRVRQWLPRL